MKHRTLSFMRTSVSLGLSLFIGSIIILIAAESVFPGFLYSDAEAASVNAVSDTLALPFISTVVAAEPTADADVTQRAPATVTPAAKKVATPTVAAAESSATAAPAAPPPPPEPR